MITRKIVFRLLFILLIVAVLADAVIVLASLLKEAKEYYFVWWQWENFGWIVAVIQSFIIGVAYVAVTIFGFKSSSSFSDRKSKGTAFFVVLANTYSVIVLWRIADSLFFLQRVFEAYAHVFMALHLVVAAGWSIFFIAINKEKEETK